MKIIATLFFTLILSSPLMAAKAVNFNVSMSGANEVPPNTSTTTGTAQFHANQNLTEIDFRIDVKNAEDILGLAGAHLHCAAAGVNGPVVAFLAGPFTPGFDGALELRGTLNDQSIINTTCGATILALVESMVNGNVYVNMHSTALPGGVIRGQVQ